MSAEIETLPQKTRRHLNKALALTAITATAAIPSLATVAKADSSASYPPAPGLVTPETNSNSQLTPEEQALNNEANDGVAKLVEDLLGLNVDQSQSQPRPVRGITDTTLYERTIKVKASSEYGAQSGEYVMNLIAPMDSVGHYITDQTQFLSLKKQTANTQKGSLAFSTITFSRNPINQAWELGDQFGPTGSITSEYIAPENPNLPHADQQDLAELLGRANKFINDARAKAPINHT